MGFEATAPPRGLRPALTAATPQIAARLMPPIHPAGWTWGAERCNSPRRLDLKRSPVRPPAFETVGTRMTIGTRLFTWWRGELVGTDQLGNRYYNEKGGRKLVRGGGMP